MPPSGYSSPAVGGACIFIKTTFLDLLAEVRAGKHVSMEMGVKYEIALLEAAMSKLPDNATKGIFALTHGCYVELLAKLLPETAIDATLNDLNQRFGKLHIDPKGNLVERA